MAVRIRLTRVGATKRPAYRVIAIDQRRSRDGRALEILGYYDPLTEPATVQLQSDRISAWIGKGAQPSDTVARLMRQAEREAAGPPSDAPKRPAKSKGIVASSPKAASKPKASKAKARAADATADEAATTTAAEESAGADGSTTAQDSEATEATAATEADATDATESPQSTEATDTAVDAAADAAVEPAVAEETDAADEAPAPDGESGEPKA